MEAEITLRSGVSANDLDLLEPLWGALQAHHATVLPTLGDPHATPIARRFMGSTAREVRGSAVTADRGRPWARLTQPRLAVALLAERDEAPADPASVASEDLR